MYSQGNAYRLNSQASVSNSFSVLIILNILNILPNLPILADF